MSGRQAKFLIIDGSSLVHRAFYALPLLQTKQGIYTNAVYGFTAMLLRLLEEEKPDYVVVAFDKGGPTFRHEEYEEYKAKREKTPGELAEQFALVRDVLAALRLPVAEEQGLEADDLIGTFASKAVTLGVRPVIVSGDGDVFQLTGLPAEVIFTRRGISQTERYSARELAERFGLSPAQFIDYKALKGDPSDNIPGVPGIGEKTALRLLARFGSLDGIYEHLAEIGGKLAETLAAHKDQAYLSQKLATIVVDAPLEFRLEDFARREPDYEKLRGLFEVLEFRSMLDKIPKEALPRQHSVFEAHSKVEDATGWRRLAEAARSAGQVAVLADPPGASWQRGLQALVIALPEKTFHISLDRGPLPEEASFLSDMASVTVVYDAKAWVNICHRFFGREPSGPVFDASLAAYLLDPLENGYPLEKLADRYLARKLPAPTGGRRKEETCGRDFACAAARALFDLCSVLRQNLQGLGLDELYCQLELPLAYTLARMERIGVAVDLQALAEMKTELEGRIVLLEREIYALAGETFNLNSPKQLATVLFEKLGLPAIKKTKTGLSTDAEVLEALAPHHKVAAKILEYRMLSKLLTTYLDGLSRLVNPETGRVHTTFNQTVTATGRLSSTEPNLQNIPIRLEEGRRVRRAFVPGEAGRLLLSADYSQIELRILAHFSADSVLVESFCREEDIHRRTAAEVFGVSPEEVTREMRDRAKAVNFGIIYGISDYGLSRQLGIPRQEARIYIERYLQRYPGVRQYISEIVEQARKNGFVTTLLGRRRYLPGITSRNFTERSFAERTAMNTPIQGSAADIIKLAMLHVEEALSGFGAAARMILQVHDELVFEVEERVLPEVARLVRAEMEGAVRLLVPLTVEVKAGPNWAEMEVLELGRGEQNA